MSNSKRVELKGATIISVTSPATVQRIAKEHAINPQEVFVRVVFAYEGNEYSSSNKLRFFGEEGYEKLLTAKASNLPVDIIVTANDKGTLMYLANEESVSIKDLFKEPVTKKNEFNDILNLF